MNSTLKSTDVTEAIAAVLPSDFCVTPYRAGYVSQVYYCGSDRASATRRQSTEQLARQLRKTLPDIVPGADPHLAVDCQADNYFINLRIWS